jgi:hypothetical protein
MPVRSFMSRCVGRMEFAVWGPHDAARGRMSDRPGFKACNLEVKLDFQIWRLIASRLHCLYRMSLQLHSRERENCCFHILYIVFTSESVKQIFGSFCLSEIGCYWPKSFSVVVGSLGQLVLPVSRAIDTRSDHGGATFSHTRFTSDKSSFNALARPEQVVNWPWARRELDVN